MKKLILLVGLLITAASPTMADSYDYGNVEMGGGGFVSAVIASPIEENVIYARTDVGGAYSWDNTKERWIPMLDWVNNDERGLLGVEALAVDPTTPGKLYLMTGTVYWNQADDGIGRSALLKSEDYGKTWTKHYVWSNSVKNFNVHGNGMGRGNGEALAVDPANSDIMFYGSKNKGLWKSTDNGDSWNKVTSFPVDTTWNGSGMSFVIFDPSTKGADKTTRIYVGALKAGDNVFVSDDAGATWSVLKNRPKPTYDGTDADVYSGSKIMRLMPQRAVVNPDGSSLIITFANGAGPHTMAWDEGWGKIQDWFNRGAVYKYDVASKSWSDISPQNLLTGDTGWESDSLYLGGFSGVSIDPNKPDHIVVSSIASYRGTQYWMMNGKWKDCWGDNIYTTQDGGKTWAPAFKYVWTEGGMIPDKLMDDNGYPWIQGNTIHWIGSTCIDPFNPKRVFVTSGNGVFRTDNIFDYTSGLLNTWDKEVTVTQKTVWKFSSSGIEETVPSDVVSIPGGPLVSTIYDYEGFVHDDIHVPSSKGNFKVDVGGEMVSLGSNTSLAYASKSGKLARTYKIREVELKYNNVAIGPISYSSDSGRTWSVETYAEKPADTLHGGQVALSADGSVTLWMPDDVKYMYRNGNSEWSTVSGIDFSGRPIADTENSDKFYVYNKETGFMYVSTDGGVSFTKGGEVGKSNFRNAKAVFGHEGDVWVPVAVTDESGNRIGKLRRSTDGGLTFTDVPGVGYCEAVGFGKAAPDADYPTVFVVAEVDGAFSVYRSNDAGATWDRVNDEEHEYGGLANGEFIVGDKNYYGLYYMSTAGRGIVYANVQGIVAISDDIEKMSAFAEKGYSLVIAPNPIKIADLPKVSVKSSTPDEELDGAVIEVFNTNGAMVATSKVLECETSLIHPYLKAGVYKAAIITKDGKVKALTVFTIIK